MSVESDLELIKKYQKEIKLIDRVLNLLDWDQQTNMPKKGINARAEQMAYLSGLAHEKKISKEFIEAVERLKKGKLEGEEGVLIERLHYNLVKDRKLSKDFVEEMARAKAIAENVWEEAKEKNDFLMFKPYLEKIIELKRKEAKLKGLPGHPYNSLLDDYEQGMTVEKLKPQFEKLKKGIIELIRKIEKTKNYKEQKLILTKKSFPREMQMQLAKDVVKRIGLEETNSRIDFSEHPFSATIGTNDVRITTNIREDPLFSFSSSAHEAGHSLYELGKPEEHFYDVLWEEPSLGIHESQSRFWENMIALGKPFWRFYFPKFDKLFKLGGDFEQWYKEVNYVEPGKIRIESDEVHYCLHIILRFEMEVGLIEGSINVTDIRKIWNEKMKEYIGVYPENEKEGALQDTHWGGGYIGYFPTYAIGSIYAAQLYNQMKEEIKEVEKEIEKGEFEKIRDWLREKVHMHGKKYLADDLIKDICGEGLNIDVYLDYLNEKYGEIYGI